MGEVGSPGNQGAPIAWSTMGLSQRQLGAGEQVVVEVHRGRGRLVVPSLAVLVAVGSSASCLVIAGRPTATGVGTLRIVAWLTGGLAGVALIWLLGRFAAWRAETVTVTSARLVLSRGVLRRNIDQVHLARVVEVHVVQRLRQRLTRRGDVVLELVDGAAVVVEALRQPEVFQRVLQRQIEASDGAGASVGDRRMPSASRALVVTEFDPTPPRGTPSVSASASTASLIRLDEIDRLEAEGSLEPIEAARRRAEIRGERA